MCAHGCAARPAPLPPTGGAASRSCSAGHRFARASPSRALRGGASPRRSRATKQGTEPRLPAARVLRRLRRVCPVDARKPLPAAHCSASPRAVRYPRQRSRAAPVPRVRAACRRRRYCGVCAPERQPAQSQLQPRNAVWSAPPRAARPAFHRQRRCRCPSIISSAMREAAGSTSIAQHLAPPQSRRTPRPGVPRRPVGDELRDRLADERLLGRVLRHRSTSLRIHRSPATAWRKEAWQVGTHHSSTISTPSVDRVRASPSPPS